MAKTESTQRIRIKIRAFDHKIIDQSTRTIIETAQRTGAQIVGPIPLPTKKLKITTRKSPCGDGTATFDNFEMRIHSRGIDIPADDRVLHAIMRLYIPREVTIKIEMKE